MTRKLMTALVATAALTAALAIATTTQAATPCAGMASAQTSTFTAQAKPVDALTLKSELQANNSAAAQFGLKAIGADLHFLMATETKQGGPEPATGKKKAIADIGGANILAPSVVGLVNQAALHAGTDQVALKQPVIKKVVKTATSPNADGGLIRPPSAPSLTLSVDMLNASAAGARVG